MLQLEQGRSYIWLFAIYLIVFFGGFAASVFLGNPRLGVLTIPAFLAFLLSCELRSGIALGSWWRALHPEGTEEYRAHITWHAACIILLLVVSFIVIFFIQ